MNDLTDMLGLALRVGLGGLMVWAVVWVWTRPRQSDADDDADESQLDGPDPCAHCGYDVRGGLDRCPECGRSTPAARRRRLADLRTRWPAETLRPRVPDPAEQPVVVLTTDAGPAAELLRQHLEARGIAARTAGPQPIGGSVYTGHSMGGHRLIVWSADEERARAIIARLWIDDGDRPATEPLRPVP